MHESLCRTIPPSAVVDSDFGIDYTNIEDQEYFTAKPKSNRCKANKV